MKLFTTEYQVLIRTKHEPIKILLLWGKAVQFIFFEPEMPTLDNLNESECKADQIYAIVLVVATLHTEDSFFRNKH